MMMMKPETMERTSDLIKIPTTNMEINQDLQDSRWRLCRHGNPHQEVEGG